MIAKGLVPASVGRVLVVDDDPSFCELVRVLLEGAGYEVAAVATGRAAIDAVRACVPAAVLLDVSLPDLSGYEVCRAIRADLGPDVPVVFVSGARTESFDRVAGLLIGADDYLAKPFAPDELLARLRALIRRRPPAGADSRASALTVREREVLALLAEGLDQREIARRLMISPKTCAKHIEHILEKLGVHSRAQAVALAYRDHLLGTPV